MNELHACACGCGEVARSKWVRGHNLMATRRDPMERFYDLLNLDPETDCWIWIGSHHPAGYGRFCDGNGKHVQAHRFAYEQLVGPIPPGLQLDHFWCQRPACVNPKHLRPATSYENSLTSGVPAANRAKTHCPKGHPYEDWNTYWTRRGGRACRRCTRDSNRERMRRVRAARPRRQGVLCPNGHPYVDGSWYWSKYNGYRRCRICERAKNRRQWAKRRARQLSEGATSVGAGQTGSDHLEATEASLPGPRPESLNDRIT